MKSKNNIKAFVTFLASMLIGIVLVASPAMAADQQQSNWSAAGGNEANTYFVPDTIGVNLVAKDSPVINGYGPLVVANGLLYVVDRRDAQKMYAVDLATNKVKWEFTSEGTENPIQTLIATNGMVYVAASKKVYALEDAGSAATIKWSKDSFGSLKTFDGSSIFFADNNSFGAEKKVTAVDLHTGDIRWTHSLGKFDQLVYDQKVAAGGGRLFFTLKDSQSMQLKMYSLDSTTGEVMWTTDLFGDSSGVPVYVDGKVFLDANHFITALDAKTGNVLWKYDVKFGKFPSYVMSANHDTVFTTNSEGYLIALNKDTGVERWKVLYAEVYVSGGRQQDNVSNGATLVTTDKVFLENHGKIKIYDVNTGGLLRAFDLGEGAQTTRFSPVAIASGMLFATGGDKLYTYRPAAEASDTTKPYATFESVQPQRFSPYEDVSGRKQTQLRFWLSKDANAQLAVLKEDGHAVRNIDLGWVPTGWNDRYWDGKDDQGNMVPYGRYFFRITLTDVYGNKGYSEDRTKIAVVGDVLGKTLKNANLRTGPGTGYEIQQVTPAGTELFIQDESAGWYQVVRVDNRSSGFISKSLVGTRTHPGPVESSTPPNVVQTPQSSRYTVQANESLYLIAKKLGVGLAELMKVNPQVKPENVYAGLVLQVPQKASKPAAASTYTVQTNDTLYLIAKKLGVGLAELMKANPQVKPENVYVGFVLQVPQKA